MSVESETSPAIDDGATTDAVDERGESSGEAGEALDDASSEDGDGEGTGGGGVLDDMNDDIDAFIDSFAAWADPPPASKVPVGEPAVSDPVIDANQSYECIDQQFDATGSYERILATGGSHSEVVPGVLLQGGKARQGLYETITASRSPLTLSVNLPIANPVRVVADPTVANLQAAVAQFQLDIDAELGVVSIQSFDHATAVTESFAEATSFFGVDIDHDEPLREAGIDSAFEVEEGLGNTSFSVRHIEELFTITFAADELPAPSDFFADDVTLADLENREALGELGPENPPVFVGSVTYGRGTLASAATSHQYDSEAFATIIAANDFGSAAGPESQEAYEELAEGAPFELLAMGVTYDEALVALRGAAIEDMFGPPTAGAAVPLYYEMNFMTGERRKARLGDTLHYAEQSCHSIGPAPCGSTCGDAWEIADEETCMQSGDGASGHFDVGDVGGHLESFGAFAVPTPDDAATARVCGSAHYEYGGLWNDDGVGFAVNCGDASRVVLRNELWSGVDWCWDDVPVGTDCSIAVGVAWTPWLRGNGWASADLWVDHYETPTRCYEDQW